MSKTIKLTAKEYAICEAVPQSCVLARDSEEMGGRLFLYTGFPKYAGGLKVWSPYFANRVRINDDWFKFITWDSGCWLVTTLLELGTDETLD